MEHIVLDFYNKEVNNILDMLTHIEPGWNKDFLTYGQIANYVDTLGLSEGRRTEVYITLKDFFFNHLYEFQKIILGLPDNVLDEEENKQNALRYLHKLYGDKTMTKEDLMYKVGDFVHYSCISMDPDFDDKYGYGTIIEIKDLPKSFEKETEKFAIIQVKYFEDGTACTFNMKEVVNLELLEKADVALDRQEKELQRQMDNMKEIRKDLLMNLHKCPKCGSIDIKQGAVSTPDEIVRKLNKMEPPKSNFKVEGNGKQAIQIQSCINIAFESGYKQAVKEMREYFEIGGNGIHEI